MGLSTFNLSTLYKRSPLKVLTIAVSSIFGLAACMTTQTMSDASQDKIQASKQYADGKFINTNKTSEQNLSKMWTAGKDFLFNKHDRAVPTLPLPIKPVEITSFDLSDSKALRFTRLGHSSMMIQISGKIVLTDPVFSERTSPVQWAGPKRFHPVPLNINDLPEVEAVVISHNHFDHLDQGSINQLKNKVNHFVVPLGIGQTLLNWGVAADKITELDWWDAIKFNDIELVATPAQHFSGRGLFDRDETLWASWVIRNSDHALFFSGDTGYFDGFKQIGEKYGPFDYAFMECGAYNQIWRDIHMMPEDTMQAFKDINGKVLIPVHNGTFDLSTHAWFDPFLQIEKLAQENNVTLMTPVMGEIIDKQHTFINYAWWEPYLSEEAKISLKKMRELELVKASTVVENQLN